MFLIITLNYVSWMQTMHIYIIKSYKYIGSNGNFIVELNSCVDTCKRLILSFWAESMHVRCSHAPYATAYSGVGNPRLWSRIWLFHSYAPCCHGSTSRSAWFLPAHVRFIHLFYYIVLYFVEWSFWSLVSCSPWIHMPHTSHGTPVALENKYFLFNFSLLFFLLFAFFLL